MEGIDRVAYTAFLTAHIRASEKSRTDPIFEDPYAPLFHHETSARAMESYERFAIFLSIIRVRTRWGDELLKRSLEQGTTQVLTLGAGFDSRPLRFPKAGVTYYEVDRPELLSYKTARLAEKDLALGAVPISADYTTSGLADALLTAGLDPSRPTLVLWEGNTFYLPIDRVTEVLYTLAGALQRPRIAFDYFASAIIEGRSGSPELRKATEVLKSIGAPWIGGIDDPHALASSVGLEVEGDRCHRSLHEEYLPLRSLGPDIAAEVGYCVLRRP